MLALFAASVGCGRAPKPDETAVYSNLLAELSGQFRDEFPNDTPNELFVVNAELNGNRSRFGLTEAELWNR